MNATLDWMVLKITINYLIIQLAIRKYWCIDISKANALQWTCYKWK